MSSTDRARLRDAQVSPAPVSISVASALINRACVSGALCPRICCPSDAQKLHSGHAFQSTLDRLVVSIDSTSIPPAAPLENRILLYRAVRSSAPSLASASTSRSDRSRGASRSLRTKIASESGHSSSYRLHLLRLPWRGQGRPLPLLRMSDRPVRAMRSGRSASYDASEPARSVSHPPQDISTTCWLRSRCSS